MPYARWASPSECRSKKASSGIDQHRLCVCSVLAALEAV
jgi:hypothetical protein